MVWRYQQLPTNKNRPPTAPRPLLGSEEHLIPIGDGTPRDGDVTHLHQGTPGVRAMASEPGEHGLRVSPGLQVKASGTQETLVNIFISFKKG